MAVVSASDYLLGDIAQKNPYISYNPTGFWQS